MPTKKKKPEKVTARCRLTYKTAEISKATITLDLRPVKLTGKTGSKELKLKEDYFLAWLFRGKSGAEYKITIDVPTGYEVRTLRTYPFTGKIPKISDKSSDRARFYVRREKKKKEKKKPKP